MFIGNAIAIGAGRKIGSIPQQLGAVVHIEDFTTPVNGYWVDKSGKNKQIQAATTTTLNDSLIMPANDADIIVALKRINEYSKYYISDSTPKTVLIREISQVSRISSRITSGNLVTGNTYNVIGNSINHNNSIFNDGQSFIAQNSNYVNGGKDGTCILGLDNASFFNSKNNTNFILFNKSIKEQNLSSVYNYVFDYMPITQVSDSFSISLKGNGIVRFDWDDNTFNEYNLNIASFTNINHTWTNRLGSVKNIKVSGDFINITHIKNSGTTNTSQYTLCLSNLDLLKSIDIQGCEGLTLTGDLSNKILDFLRISASPISILTGDITKSLFTTLWLETNFGIEIYGDISNDPITNLRLTVCPKLKIYGSLSNMYLNLFYVDRCLLVNLYGSIDKIPASISYYYISKSNLTYDGGDLAAYNVNITINSNWTTDMVDLFLNKLSISSPIVSGKTIDISMGNACPSETSNTYISILESKGWVVLVTKNGYVFEGDSITYGYMSTDASKKWTSIFCLNKNKIEVNRGDQGKLLSPSVTANPKLSFFEKIYSVPRNSEIYNNKLFIAFGINDVGSAIPISDFIDFYKKSINYLLNTKKYNLNQIKIINIYYSISYKNACVNYNTALKNMCLELNIQYIDIYAYMFSNGGDGLISSDKLHPNDLGHAAIAACITSQINN